MRILGIESSCDELAAAVLERDGRTVLAHVVHSQVELHARYGGVVPEVASRDHVRAVGPVVRAALVEAGVGPAELDGIAVTAGPGLIGSLLTGLEAAKGLALALDRPLVGIHHLEAHLAAADLEPDPPRTPHLALIVSGGHTSLVRVAGPGGPYAVLGATRDDAAGEAFDKVAKAIGLGYPGGARVDRLAATGDPTRFAYPVAMRDRLDFSFSGLKTAALRHREGLVLEGQTLADFCASFQAGIVENLLVKAFLALARERLDTLVIVGGVAANRGLRAEAARRAEAAGIRLVLPDLSLCTDNAAMVARAGFVRLSRGERSPLDLGARSFWPLDEVR